MLLVIVLTYAWAHRIEQPRRAWQMAAAALIGVAVGLGLHPNFPAIIIFSWWQIFHFALIPGKVFSGVEWYPYEPIKFMIYHVWIFAVSVCLFIFALLNQWVKKIFNDHRLLSLGLVGLGLLFLALFMKRYAEYFIPIGGLLLALAGENLRQAAEISPKAVSDKSAYRQIILVALILIFSETIIQDISIVKKMDKQISREISFTRLKSVSEWLAQSLPAGTIVANVYWDEFPELFYFNDRLRYASGLDPRFLIVASPDYAKVLYGLLIYRPDSKNKLYDYARFVEEKNGPVYLLVSRRGKDLVNDLPSIGKLLYEDSEATVWLIN